MDKLKSVVLCSLFLICSCLAQDIHIDSLHGNGQLEWSGVSVGTTSTVEWAANLQDDPVVWHTFTNIVATNSSMIIDVPMFFRILGTPISVTPFYMVQIPGGTVSGTNPLAAGESYNSTYPESYSLTVTTFYMDASEVTKTEWDEVATWASTNDYDITTSSASGKGGNHPVYNVTWYECLKWCNARSEMESKTPSYSVDGSIYKAGIFIPICDFNVDGFRLPTIEEWEYAARGGLANKRFPWGNTISHNEANYYGRNINYDLSTGYNPGFTNGVAPYTNPVGALPANGYGIFDMAGNLFEWCWDLVGSSSREMRGGCWYGPRDFGAPDARCSHIQSLPQGTSGQYYGFRTVCR